MVQGGSEWKEDVRKKRKRKENLYVQGRKCTMDIAKSGEKIDLNRINSVSYYFSEIPDAFGALEMLCVSKI